MNNRYLRKLDGAAANYFDVAAVSNSIEPGAYSRLPYTSKVLAENLVRRATEDQTSIGLKQILRNENSQDFPWYPAMVVCHDILGQTALVDLAGLREAFAAQGGNPSNVNPVVPTQLIVDHSLAVEYGGYEPDARLKNQEIEQRRNDDRFHFIEWTKKAIQNVDVVPPGNVIMHQINHMTSFFVERKQ